MTKSVVFLSVNFLLFISWPCEDPSPFNITKKGLIAGKKKKLMLVFTTILGEHHRPRHFSEAFFCRPKLVREIRLLDRPFGECVFLRGQVFQKKFTNQKRQDK